MSDIISCPECKRSLRVPEDLLGKPVKCPACQLMFLATRPAEPSPAAESFPTAPTPPPLPDEDFLPTLEPWPTAPAGNNEPVPSSGSGRRNCPRCGETVSGEGLYCPFCREPLGGSTDRPWEQPIFRGRRDAEPDRGAMILTFGIISIVCVMLCYFSVIGLPLGIAAWVMGKRDLEKIRAGVMDRRGEGNTQAGMICGIIGTILCGLGSLFCVGYIGVVMFAVLQGK